MIPVERFPSARAIRPPGAPPLLVNQRATLECGCAVYAGQVAGKNQPAVVPWLCDRHKPRLGEFNGYLAEAFRDSTLTLDELARLAADLLEAVFAPAHDVGSSG